MSKSILLIGNANSALLRELVTNLRKSAKPPFKRIDIISYQRCRDEVDLFDAVYDRDVSTAFKYPIINSIYRWYTLRQLLKNVGHYDYCHIHSVNFIYSFLIKLIKKKSNSLIVTYWGSDYYRISKLKRFLHRKLLKQADMISAATPTILNLIKSSVDLEPDKFKMCRFGLTPLNEIKKLSQVSKPEALEKLNLPAAELVITCGYNASDKQYHQVILEQIKEIASELPRETLLILPMTYNGSTDYAESIKQVATSIAFETKFYTSFLDARDNALLRMVSDIMIQVQPTDQFSGSMQEYIFAGNYIITGAWLPYDQLRENGVFFKQVEARDQIGAAIKEFVSNQSQFGDKLKSNREFIWELSSWEKTIDDWISLYNGN